MSNKITSEMWQTHNANKEKYLSSTNLITKAMPKAWIELWQQIEIWYGDIKQRETAEQLLNRIIPAFLASINGPKVCENCDGTGNDDKLLGIIECHICEGSGIEPIKEIIPPSDDEIYTASVVDNPQFKGISTHERIIFQRGGKYVRDLWEQSLSRARQQGCKDLSEITQEDAKVIFRIDHNYSMKTFKHRKA